MFLKNFFHDLLITIVLALILGAMTEYASAQGVYEQTIEVCTSKTSFIVFPADIKPADLGSRDILSQKMKGVNNVLKIKAGKLNFKETNLTVITADGALNHFIVRFNDKPARQIYYASQNENLCFEGRPAHNILLREINHAEVEQTAQYIISKKASGKVKAIRKNNMAIILKGIYIESDLMYFHVRLTNRSNIPYDVDMLRFYTRDKQRVKRTATQEVAEPPLYILGNATRVDGKTEVDLVYVLPKFTIPDAKVLTLQLMEKRGGRHLTLNIKNRSIVHAQTPPNRQS